MPEPKPLLPPKVLLSNTKILRVSIVQELASVRDASHSVSERLLSKLAGQENRLFVFACGLLRKQFG
jgi:hypothetical protein